MQTVTEAEIPSSLTTAFVRWQAGELTASAAATAIVQELLTEIQPQEQALEARKQARRTELGTLLLRFGAPLEVLGRVVRWVEPSTAETANVKKLRKLIAELRDQRVPALDDIASHLQACITQSARRGYPLIEPPRPGDGSHSSSEAVGADDPVACS